MTKVEHLRLLTDAIDATISARINFENKCPPPETTGPLQFLNLSKEYDASRGYLEAVIENPIHKAVRGQLKRLGEQLFNLTGSTDAMLEVCYEVASRDPRHEGYRLDILDKAWDGIGSKNDLWIA